MRSITALSLLIFALACQKTETATSSTTSTQSTASTATTATVASAPQPTTTTAAAATPAPATGAVASTDGEKAGAHIDVTEFKRSSGNTVTLKFVLTNNGSEKFDMWGHRMGDSPSEATTKRLVAFTWSIR